MGLTAKVTPVRRDIDLAMAEALGAKARSAYLAQFAAEGIKEAQRENARLLGRVPSYDVWVDGRHGAPLASVKPDGVITAEFDLATGAIAWIMQQLETHSPVLTGRYRSSHTLYADGVEVADVTNPPLADEYTFLNIQPYARKLERGVSPQAPDGVYQAVAVLARRRWGRVLKIDFSYRTAVGGDIIGGKAGDRSSLRNPAIIVRMR